jgi:hypothetical protein
MGVYDDHQSGYWAVSKDTAEGLIGTHIYFVKAVQSYLVNGGKLARGRIHSSGAQVGTYSLLPSRPPGFVRLGAYAR